MDGYRQDLPKTIKEGQKEEGHINRKKNGK